MVELSYHGLRMRKLINLFKTNKPKFFMELGFVLLSFIIPLVMAMIISLTNNISLFTLKGNTIMLFDMSSQYICYMNDFKTMLETGGSFIYTTEKALGGDYLSLYTYYLASPFNFLVVFFSHDAIPLFFVWTGIIKMALGSTFFYLFTRLTSRFTPYKLIGAIGYGLISYSFVYLTNFMWLDGVMILPLAILGLHYLRDKKHMWLYPLALFYTLLSSWYIGFMVCIFIALYFIVLFIKDFKRHNKENYIFLARFTVFSLLGGLVAAPFWFTAIIHLSGTKGTTSLPQSFFLSINVLISGLLENNYDNPSIITQNNSYLSMFVGMIPLVFSTTYFFNKSFTKQERFAFLGLAVFYFICSSNSVLTALLHGGREPTWFPGRYSFVIGFLICLLTTRSMDEADKLHPLYYLAPTILGVVAIILLKTLTVSSKMKYYSISGISLAIYFVAILIGAFYSSICYFNLENQLWKNIKHYSVFILSSLIALQVISLYRGGDKVMSTNISNNRVTNYSTYLADTSYLAPVNALKEYEKQHDNNSFYRMEMTINRPGNYNLVNNNPMFYSYSGLSHFSSSSKKSVDQYLSTLGFHYNGFFTKYENGSTFTINSLLGIKYLMEDTSMGTNKRPYFLKYDTFTKIDIDYENPDIGYYYNPYYINMGFLSDKTGNWYTSEGKKLSPTYTYWYDKFEYQNEIFRCINRSFGKDIYYPLEITDVSTSLEVTKDEAGLTTYLSPKVGSTIKYTFKLDPAHLNDPVYFSEKNYYSDANYYIDNKKYDISTYWSKGITALNIDTSRDSHTLEIMFTKGKDKAFIRPELYYEDLTLSKEFLSTLKDNELKINNISQSITSKSYNGTLNITEKKDKDLIFTLPYESELEVYIDNKRVDVEKKYNIFTAVDVSSLEVGEHQITISYVDRGFRGNCYIGFTSLIGLSVLIAFYPVVEQKVFYRKKEEVEAN